MAFLTDYRAVFPEDLNDHTMLDDHFLIYIEGHLFPERVIVSRRPEGGRVEYRDYTPAPNDRLERLEAEVAKLRELVDYMEPIAWYAASPEERRRMREMGVDR
jgi:hypothetical protein